MMCSYKKQRGFSNNTITKYGSRRLNHFATRVNLVAHKKLAEYNCNLALHFSEAGKPEARRPLAALP